MQIKTSKCILILKLSNGKILCNIYNHNNKFHSSTGRYFHFHTNINHFKKNKCFLVVMDWMFGFSLNSFAKILTLEVIALGGGTWGGTWEVMRVAPSCWDWYPCQKSSQSLRPLHSESSVDQGSFPPAPRHIGTLISGFSAFTMVRNWFLSLSQLISGNSCIYYNVFKLLKVKNLIFKIWFDFNILIKFYFKSSNYVIYKSHQA